MALIVNRVIAPSSKLATVRALNPQTAASSLGERLGLGEVADREIYECLDWLVDQQERIENRLARRHLAGGTLTLYDVSSSYLEGRCCELAQHGYSRDHRPDRPQIVYGLLCNREGCPVAIEVFEGNTADPMTLAHQVTKLKARFALERVVLVGDRGMITSARIRQDLEPAGLDWITALRAPKIQQLADGGPLQLSLFDDRDLAEISSPDYPGERLIVCRNPLLAAERRGGAPGSTGSNTQIADGSGGIVIWTGDGPAPSTLNLNPRIDYGTLTLDDTGYHPIVDTTPAGSPAPAPNQVAGIGGGSASGESSSVSGAITGGGRPGSLDPRALQLAAYRKDMLNPNEEIIGADVVIPGGGGHMGLPGQEIGPASGNWNQGSEVLPNPYARAIGGTTPRGGTYLLRDAESEAVMRTGRTGDLLRRAAEHARDRVLKDFIFEPVHRTGIYSEQRGLEQMLYDLY
jgi:hypothetical protein